jgi:uncharacterized membrane protein YhaH (DUF805 family)
MALPARFEPAGRLSGTTFSPAGSSPTICLVVGIVIFIFAVLATGISIAVAVKRYHDRNKSGWWVLIVFVPVIGGLWYLIECGFLRGTPGPNNYGPDPLAAI